MEENENKTVEVAEEEVTQPSREEILAMSRKENKKGDEREGQWYAKAGTFAFCCGLLLAGIILIVSVFAEDKLRCDILLIVSAMQAVQQIIVGLHNRRLRKVSLTAGIVEAVCSVIFLILWILQLCGVV